MASPSFDYIILGGGSAGSVLANRLSENPTNKVLLLEAGGKGRSLFIRMPAANGFLFGKPEYDWGLRSIPQPQLNGREIYYPRGRGLGGSSAINGMICIRGHASDYDGWRQRGLPGWGYADVLPYFNRSESSPRHDDIFHGTDGPLETSKAKDLHGANDSFLLACEQLGLPRTDDFNGADQYGFGKYDLTISGGERSTASKAYVEPVRSRSNLNIETGANIQRLIIEDGRAVGARYEKDAQKLEVRASAEVLVCLGAFGSPHLLLRSGIGPGAELQDAGIAAVHDLAGVGKNLQDHPNIPVLYDSTDPSICLSRYQRLDRAAWLGLRYLLARKGPGTEPFWCSGVFASMDSSNEAAADIQMHFTPMVVVEDPEDRRNQTASAKGFDINVLGRKLLARGKYALPGFQFDVNLMRPRSVGEVKLDPGDTNGSLMIDPQILAEQVDCDLAVEGVKFARSVVSQPAFDDSRGAELSPGTNCQSDDELLAAIRDVVVTGHHPVGTCKMGIDGDNMAVLDAELRVKGIQGLRVVDASIMPMHVTGNTNMPVIMIAEKASDMILGRDPLPRAEI